MPKISPEEVIYELVDHWVNDQSLSAEDIAQRFSDLAGTLARISRQLRQCNLISPGANTYSASEILSKWQQIRNPNGEMNHQDLLSYKNVSRDVNPANIGPTFGNALNR